AVGTPDIRSRPVILDLAPDPVYSTFFEPPSDAGGAGGTAVLICPPWGWDEVTSYRARGAWATRLAAEGRPSLRVDLPGAGASPGPPADAGLADAWIDAVAGAAAWLAALPDVDRVAAIGLGLGGLLAAAAIGRGAPIDDLVLWAAPETGRAWIRELRAF